MIYGKQINGKYQSKYWQKIEMYFVTCKIDKKKPALVLKFGLDKS